MQTLTKVYKKDIISENLRKMGYSPTYTNGTFMFSCDKTTKAFEQEFQSNLSTTVIEYLETKRLIPKSFNRSITYSIIIENGNGVINF